MKKQPLKKVFTNSLVLLVCTLQIPEISSVSHKRNSMEENALHTMLLHDTHLHISAQSTLVITTSSVITETIPMAGIWMRT